MITISVINAGGEVLFSASHENEVRLGFSRTYEPGDAVLVQTEPGTHLMFQPAATLLPGEVYLPDGKLTWKIPEGERRLGYFPGTFDAKQQIAYARVMTAEEIHTVRDIALNPADLRGDTDFYPHCTANVETRDESCFAARNVINGMRFNAGHGLWPFLSWGIGARADAWCNLDFGREVEIDRMALTLRADFPHDAYWIQGTVEFSDGETFTFPLEKTADRQYIETGRHRVRWMRLVNLIKNDDPSAFPSLSEWEVFGRDL